MRTEYKNLRFIEKEQKPKTKVWMVEGHNTMEPLGTVKWLGGWGRYVFFPWDNCCAFDYGCLSDLASFLKEAMGEYEKSKKNKNHNRL